LAQGIAALWLGSEIETGKVKRELKEAKTKQ
jgi:hypothetical protein